MAEINAYYCPVCKKYTKHIEITYREAVALEGLDTFNQILHAISLDYLRLGKLAKTITGVSQYKCMECGRPTCRNLKGGEGLYGSEEELKK